MTKLLDSLITELRVTDLSKEDEPTKYFLLYKDKLFILDKNSPFKTINSRLKSHIKVHPGLDRNKDHKWSAIKERDDIRDFLKNMSDISPDITVGEYYPENSAIVLWGDVQARSSLNVKKVVQQLGVQNITMRHLDEPTYDDVDVKYAPDELEGDIPDVVYHGTLSHQLGSILKYGIDPGRGRSQFSKQGVFHPEHNFFTATFQEALHYAYNAKYQAKHKWDAFPVVLEIEIPDKSLVGPDYDYDYSTTSPRYFTQRAIEPQSKATMKSMGMSREVGKWSYKGRIPANHIRWVYYYLPFEHKWKKSRPETWVKLLNKYDWETIAYKLGLQGGKDEL